MDAELRHFPPFRLDSNNEQLWRGSREIRLRRKTFAVLRHLVEHQGELVTKAALLDAVWPDVSVSDSMPAISVRELRKALGDAAQTPRFIETVQRRGYRFIAEVKLASVHAPTAPAARQSSFAMQTQQTSFVGREHERSELRGALTDATSGRGRICLISGEAGIGKTRLCTEISREAEKNGVAVLVGHCSEQETVPYLPFIEILESLVDHGQSPDDLRRAMGEEGPELSRLLPKLRRMIPELPPPMELAAEQARRQLFNSFSNFIARRSREQATMLVLEDLHWADDSTLALINHLSQRRSDWPLLMIATYRESEIDISPSLSKTLEDLVRARLATQIRLEGLPSIQVAQMLQGLSGQAPPPTVVNEIHRETDGNPFFVEELFRHLAEENRLYDRAGQFRPELKIEELEVPRNVRLVVGRRLGRLGEGTRKILALAAVIGRSFTFELLEAAASAKADALLDCLDEAHRIGLIRSSTQYPEARFEFSHELIRQAILTQLTVARHRRLHLEVAETIERICADTLEDHYAELAHHYSQTSNTWKAVIYLHLAGRQALLRSAHAEAIDLLTSGLNLLSSLPDTPERDRRELDLQTALLPQLVAAKGDASREVGTACGRAVELCHRVGDVSRLFPAQFELTLFHWNRAEHETARTVAKDLLVRAQRGDDATGLHAAHCLMGGASFWLGEFAVAHTHFEESMAFFDPRQHRALAFVYEPDPAAGALGYWGFTLWCLGFPDQALQRTQRMLALAQELALVHPSSLAMSLSHAAGVHFLRRDAQMGLARAEAGLALANEHGLRLWEAIHRVHICSALVMRNGQEGILKLKDALEAYWARGSRASNSILFGGLALAFGMTGKFEDADRTMAQAFSFIEETGERAYEAEVHRLKGELLLIQDTSHAARAEECFSSAIEIARGQGAKSWELRATTSLARLLDKQEKRDEARAMLAEIYNWFTEGFDTADLKDANALLDELGG